jgi:hypothetical protein
MFGIDKMDKTAFQEIPLGLSHSRGQENSTSETRDSKAKPEGFIRKQG